jgi:ankyrin repeat protein
MVRWCLDHGASVDETDETLLADVASYGSIKTFKALREHGAPTSESTLHNAAWRARPEMVTFLIDEFGLDVNNVYDGRHEPMLLRQTPLCSAAISPFKDLEEVVKILLERGADPYHNDCNAFDEARSEVALECLCEWE